MLPLLGIASTSAAQSTGNAKAKDEYFRYIIDDHGDTLIFAKLDEVSVSSLRQFDHPEDYRRYRLYRQYALEVYPYAQQAIRIFRETEYATSHLSKRKKRRYIRRLQRELKDEFADPFRKMSKTPGKILIKMIERELDTPMYSLIRELRGGVKATYWSSIARLFQHRLKEGYTKGEDRVLDAVLNDFDISYELVSESRQEEIE